ncbi:MAG: ADP-ribosylglycohydrolase family protein [Clostridia bacterium]|nr:ADP-ribosylglycohydrolase family protein [Clostridia bacterium]
MRIEDIRYPKIPDFGETIDNLERYARLAAEFGYPDEAATRVERTRAFLSEQMEAFDRLLAHPAPDPDEPEDLEAIRAVRPRADRMCARAIPGDYRERWFGSILGRGAGCTLGAGLEFQSVDNMEKWARHFGDEYPLRHYWRHVKNPDSPRYIKGDSTGLTLDHIDCIPADDDTAYTLIGLMTLERYGPEFTRAQMAELWTQAIPVRADNGSWGLYWGERNFVENVMAGRDADLAGHHMNPNAQSVAAWTRADTWGYVAPGRPEKAAELAWRDASVNHRRNGVYGEMFMAAAVSAAFVVDDPVDALRAGLCEIPEHCLFAEAVRWALGIAPDIRGYRDAAAAVTARYDGMFKGHAVNNALYVVLGICLGGKDFTRVIGETVAMGFDNDCTGATAGSIVGAVLGRDRLPPHWIQPFRNRMQCYFNGCPDYLDLDDLYERYRIQAERILGA